MQIQDKLPQFTDEEALIVASGKQDAIFYIAQNGEIHVVESFKVDKPKYDDIEGHFESSTKTGKRKQTIRAGSPYDPTDKNEKAVSDFLKELEQELESVSKHHAVTDLYIFAPPHLKNEVTARIPYSLESANLLLMEGNHYETHPFDLLEKIQEKKHKEPVKPIKKSAKKILDKFKNR
jgi:hypothetical protein